MVGTKVSLRIKAPYDVAVNPLLHAMHVGAYSGVNFRTVRFDLRRALLHDSQEAREFLLDIRKRFLDGKVLRSHQNCQGIVSLEASR